MMRRVSAVSPGAHSAVLASLAPIAQSRAGVATHGTRAVRRECEGQGCDEDVLELGAGELPLAHRVQPPHRSGRQELKELVFDVDVRAQDLEPQVLDGAQEDVVGGR